MHIRKLVLFDIDGTILRFRKFRSHKVFRDLFLDLFGKEIPLDKMPDFAGNTDLRILKDIAEANSIVSAELLERIDDIWMKLLKYFELYCTPYYLELLPGASNLIINLAKDENIQLGLLTGNFRDNAYLKLRAYHLDIFFPFGAFGSDHEDRNSLPAIAILRGNEYYLNRFKKEAGFVNENTVIIGDSPRDIECGKTNGIPVISVTTGSFRADDLIGHAPDFLFEDFRDYKKVQETIYQI